MLHIYWFDLPKSHAMKTYVFPSNVFTFPISSGKTCSVHVQLMCLIWITRWLCQPADFVARVACPYFDQAATELQAICPGLILEMCICVSKLRDTSHCLPRSQALRTTPNILRSCGMVKVMRCLQRGQKWTSRAWYMGCMVSENTYTWLHI